MPTQPLDFSGQQPPAAKIPPAPAWKPFEIPPDITASGFYVGTSGYYFDDWIGVFNPPKRKRSQNDGDTSSAEDYDRLKFYQKYFRFVEINASFYMEPVRQTYLDIDRRSLVNSLYAVKAHQSVSHTKEWDARKSKEAMERHIDAVAPLVESGRFYSFLIQLEDHNAHSLKKLEYLLAVCEPAVSRKIDVHIEFRHITWHREAVLQKLKDFGVGICNTDIPQFEHVFPLKAYATTPKGYVRYSGRNTANWYPQAKAATAKQRLQQRNGRYDYRYSEEEVEQHALDQLKLGQKTNVVAAAYNNHYNAQAVANAIDNIKALNARLKARSEAR
jgi:uncharacterized protein YecE (DUF72 family)